MRTLYQSIQRRAGGANGYALSVTYLNSMWHTDYKLLDGSRWFLCYEDNASQFVTGYGVFEHATTENALAVLEEAIKNHDKPASIMTDRGSQFYVNASESKKKGASVFEKGYRAWNKTDSGRRQTSTDQRQAGEATRQDSTQAARV